MLETEIARLKETDADRLRGEYDRLVQGLRDARYEMKKKIWMQPRMKFLLKMIGFDVNSKFLLKLLMLHPSLFTNLCHFLCH